jgi:intracellular multiplication protein IcmQ
MPMTLKEKKEKLLQLVQEALQQDKALREKYQIGGKFRFINERLQLLQTHVEESLVALKEQAEPADMQLAEDEVIVYVYLYNAQGLVLQTWHKMVNPSVFYEYSVNRPIYLDKTHVEAFIRTRTNKVQHGYLSIAVKKQDILPVAEVNQSKDAIGNIVIKVKEGSLHFDKLIAFIQGDHTYKVNEAGELIKKHTSSS